MADPTPTRRLLERRLARTLIAAALLVALAGAFVAVRATRGGPDANALPGAATPQAGEQVGPLDSARPTIGQLAPDFALRSPDGTTVKLSDLKGSVVLVNFWATWCRPCKQELPDIQKAYDEFHARGLEVLEVNYQEGGDDAARFFREQGVTLPILLDAEGGVYTQYRLQGLPDSFFVARDGTIAALQFGQLTADKLRERLAQAGLQ
jgi:peroxiredoxin